MAKKNEVRTLSVILNELNENVETYNKLPMVDPKRGDLAADAKKLVAEYNELSLLTVYGKCMEAELPLKAFVETGKYTTISTKDASHKVVQDDGSKLDVWTRSVTENDPMLDLVKFIDWAAEGNKRVTHASVKDCKEKMKAAKNAIKTEWKKYLASKGDSHSVSNRKLRGGMQPMFDALIFIPTAKNENSVIADNKIAKIAFAFANNLNAKIGDDVDDGSILPERNWKIILMKTLRAAVTGKEFIINFNEDEDEETSEKKTDAKKVAPAEENADNE